VSLMSRRRLKATAGKLSAPARRDTSAAPFRCRLIVMAKDPVMGRVKTRLARDIGQAGAIRFFRATAAAVIGRLARDPRFETIISVAPDARVMTRGLPSGVRRQPQGHGDLGARMQRIFDQAPPGPVIIVGTDIPGIRADHIARAFQQLGRHDAVFGAADDGGYWLVGLKRNPRMLRPFANVRWSTAETLADTERNLRGSTIGRAATLSDVDSAADLARIGAAAGRRVLPRSSC
jgi:uncharacterized protein